MSNGDYTKKIGKLMPPQEQIFNKKLHDNVIDHFHVFCALKILNIIIDTQECNFSFCVFLI